MLQEILNSITKIEIFSLIFSLTGILLALFTKKSCDEELKTNQFKDSLSLNKLTFRSVLSTELLVFSFLSLIMTTGCIILKVVIK